MTDKSRKYEVSVGKNIQTLVYYSLHVIPFVFESIEVSTQPRANS